MNIVFKSRDLGHGLVFQNLAFSAELHQQVLILFKEIIKEKRKEQAKISRLVTNDLNNSAAIEKRVEKKSGFLTLFW